MEPITIAVICMIGFGVVGVLAAFVRQLLLSRDKRLNDIAQKNAIAQEAQELEKIREQMANIKRYDTHYQILGENKEAIQRIDLSIESVLKRKEELVTRYSQLALKESNSIVSGDSQPERKSTCDALKKEIGIELKHYDDEIKNLQTRRAQLWDMHTDVQEYLIDSEKKRNDHLDTLFKHHSDLLEKIYMRHNENSKAVTEKTIDASTDSFKTALLAPIQFLLGLFKPSINIDTEQAAKEINSRQKVAKTESEINTTEGLEAANTLDTDDEALEEFSAG